MNTCFNDETDLTDYEEDDEAHYTLTPWGCLSTILNDYGIDFSHIHGRCGEHIVEDFMDLMVKCGYVIEKSVNN